MLTKDEKATVIQRGLSRLPVVALEAQWAFGQTVKGKFVAPPSWVRRVIHMTAPPCVFSKIGPPFAVDVSR